MLAGDYGGSGTPVPIPNTEVKTSCADGTAWATLWESRTLPASILYNFKFHNISYSKSLLSYSYVLNLDILVS
jgi:hypothetical protein